MTANRKPRELGRVHVLDDDASIRTALTRLLSAVGYEVRAHATAASYLIEPASDGPCCLILDIRMPEVSGLEIQDALARLRVSVPIIFLTGHGDIPMSVREMPRGCGRLPRKPVKRGSSSHPASRRSRADREERRPRADGKPGGALRFLTTREREVRRRGRGQTQQADRGATNASAP
jgi:FixJ family two-component response regulator